MCFNIQMYGKVIGTLMLYGIINSCWRNYMYGSRLSPGESLTIYNRPLCPYVKVRRNNMDGYMWTFPTILGGQTTFQRDAHGKYIYNRDIINV